MKVTSTIAFATLVVSASAARYCFIQDACRQVEAEQLSCATEGDDCIAYAKSLYDTLYAQADQADGDTSTRKIILANKIVRAFELKPISPSGGVGPWDG